MLPWQLALQLAGLLVAGVVALGLLLALVDRLARRWER